jgi:maltose alpha-D-glucosyltransferase/alpha-amylase
MYNEYAKDPRMRRNIGIARRLAPLLDNGRRQMEMLYSLLFSLPGSPVVYYGDEIGMGDNIYLGDRDGVRTPMQWSSDRNAGFSRADPAALYLPLLMDPVYGYQAVNVEAQERVATSFLHWLRRLLQVRKQHPVFGMGDYEPLYPENRRVFAFTRRLGADVVLVVANLSRFAQPVELDLSPWTGLVPEEMFGRTPFPIIDNRSYRLAMGPHGFYWFRLVEPPSEPDDTAMFRAIRGSE